VSKRHIVLASRSPRRRELLESAGWEVEVRVADIDDSDLDPHNADAASWTTALAWLKASAVREMLTANGDPVAVWPIVAGDTVCEHDGELVGQPLDVGDATTMVQAMADATHRVWTGLCVLVPGVPRLFGVDHAIVRVGALSTSDISEYIATGAWRGKAGGYNLSERLEAGWPITFEGHDSTIMGMPLPLLDRLLGDHTC
jgi:septum formation protein